MYSLGCGRIKWPNQKKKIQKLILGGFSSYDFDGVFLMKNVRKHVNFSFQKVLSDISNLKFFLSYKLG